MGIISECLDILQVKGLYSLALQYGGISPEYFHPVLPCIIWMGTEMCIMNGDRTGKVRSDYGSA